MCQLKSRMPHRSFQIFPARWLGASHYYGGVLSTLTLTMAISKSESICILREIQINKSQRPPSSSQSSKECIIDKCKPEMVFTSSRHYNNPGQR